MQRACRLLGGTDLTAGVVGGKLAFPLPAVLADAGGLQVVVEEADGVSAHCHVAHQAAIGTAGIGDEPAVCQRVSAEYGDGKYSPKGIFGGDVGVLPVREHLAQAVHREIAVVSELLEAKHVHLFLLHVACQFFA